jgi:hypothetical protein
LRGVRRTDYPRHHRACRRALSRGAQSAVEHRVKVRRDQAQVFRNSYALKGRRCLGESIGNAVAASITSGSVTSWVSPSAATVARPATTLSRCRLPHRLRRGVQVDGINTSGVSAGRFTLFRVVSRSQIQYFRSSRRFMRLVRFPAAPPRRCWSGPQALASFFSGHRLDGELPA